MPPTRQAKKHTSVPTGPLVATAEPPHASSGPSQENRAKTAGRPKGKGKGTAKAKLIAEYQWHPSVDYSSLNDQERQSRTILDLYTIFSLGGRNGLTVHNVRQMAKELDMPELTNSSPTTIRNAIERWNVILQSLSTNSRRCDTIGCKRPAAWGHWTEDPMTCERHKQEGMILLVPGRVLKLDDSPDGKYLMTDPLFSHIFPQDAGEAFDYSSWPELFDVNSLTELDELLQSISSPTPEETRLSHEVDTLVS